MKLNKVVNLVFLTVLGSQLMSCKSTAVSERVNSEPKNKPTHVVKQVNKKVPRLQLNELPESPFNSGYYYTSIGRIYTLFDRMLYQAVAFDDSYSERVFEKLLDAVDPAREHFSRQFIDGLSSYKHSFDDMIQSRDLSGAHQLIEVLFNEVDTRLKQEISALSTTALPEPAADTYKRVNLSERLASREVLDAHWKKRVRSDINNLLLSGLEKAQAIEVLTQRYSALQQDYLQLTVNEKYTLLMNAYARGIDPNAAYYPGVDDETLDKLQEDSEDVYGRYFWDQVLKDDNGNVVVRHLVPQTPGVKNQLNGGDALVGMIDEQQNYIDFLPLTVKDVSQLLQSKAGKGITLKVFRPEGAGIRVLDITIAEQQTAYELLKVQSGIQTAANSQSKIGVIKIPLFYNDLTEDVLTELKKITAQDISGLIIDLRNNGGGSLYEPAKLAGLFINKGPVVQVRDGSNKISLKEIKKGSVRYLGPLTVLVNGYSAGASEIFAAAIQDYGRGIILGEQTHGYGTVQQHRSIGRVYDSYDQPMGSLKFTIAKFYRINGDSTQHTGVVPDIPLKGIAVEYDREQDKDFALPWDAIAGSNYQSLHQVYRPKAKIEDIKDDMPELATHKKLDAQALFDMALKVTAAYAKNLQ